jgi:electron transport complex protein RnfB
MQDIAKSTNRRGFLIAGLRDAALLAMGTAAGLLGMREAKARTVWQIDPTLCTQCGQCATECVMEPSAVKAIHAFAMCGYCELCLGEFIPQPNGLNTGAENLQCPTGAIKRSYVEDPYYQYPIDETLCIGCSKCVKGCVSFGNGSLYLQVWHDRCLHCDECSIAAGCPSQAFVRVPANKPYIPNTRGA